MIWTARVGGLCILACLASSSSGVLSADAFAQPANSGVERLRTIFAYPPAEARPRGYWVWPHGNFDLATIRRELAAFKEKGLGGVDIFDLGVRDSGDQIPPGPGFMSPEQIDGIAFALDEAKRLDLAVGLIVSSSWNAGGTWTPPEEASMNLVAWSETVEGPCAYDRQLPFPELPETFSKSYGTFPLFVPRDASGKPRFFQDVAVLAAPLNAEGQITEPAAVRVLTDRVDPEGRLRCDLPAGRWLILRTVVTNFGQRLWLPSFNSQGLTMDHFSKRATRNHFQTIIDRLEARVGPLRETALERLYLASYEANAQVNWTPGFEAAFQELNGYAIEPFLPALFGRIVADEDTTERFRHDFRATLSELFLTNLYREASRICHDHGLMLCSEAGGPGTPLHDVPTEDLKALGSVDVMRGEFWVDKADDRDDQGLEFLQVVKPVASAAHIYGHKIVEMEAFTSHQNWQEGPADFKRLADRAFCEGMTRVVYHTMTHNLPEAGRPGWTYQAGSHMGTNLTWWDLSDQLHAYLARSSALLMEGRPTADVAYYYGHAIPKFARTKRVRPGLGPGHDYDDLNTEVLLTAHVAPDGFIELPSGMRYRLLVLPEDDRRMDLDVLEHLERLLRAGAHVLGAKPTSTYGLRGGPAAQGQLRDLANRLWGTELVAGPQEIRHGQGTLHVNQTERAILLSLNQPPDIAFSDPEQAQAIDFIHRATPGGEVYFLRNTTADPLRIEPLFRVAAGSPERWDPADGSMTSLACFEQSDRGTTLPLSLPPLGSVFIVFLNEPARPAHLVAIQGPGVDLEALFGDDQTIRLSGDVPGLYTLRFSDGQTRPVELPPAPPELPLIGPWVVRFPHGWGVPTRQERESLASWTEWDDATRAFSGTATYTCSFELTQERIRPDMRIQLDLGEVGVVARVALNGHDLGLSSFEPHRLDCGKAVRPGVNHLTVEVANTWVNRLKADAMLPEPDRLTRTNLNGPRGGVRWQDAEPGASGLIGPVRLRFAPEVSLSLSSSEPATPR